MSKPLFPPFPPPPRPPERSSAPAPVPRSSVPTPPPRSGPVPPPSPVRIPYGGVPGGPRQTASSYRAPLPSADGVMSTSDKLSLADAAMALRDEQLAARVVHYKAELATSPELDAITAKVVEELHALQRAQRAAQPSSVRGAELDKAQLEIELIESLKTMLSRLFRPGKLASTIERKIGEASKRLARLFFESELHEKIRGSSNEVKTMHFPEQALYHALSRSQKAIARELKSFDYSRSEAQSLAEEELARWLKELQNRYLARTTPELNALVMLLTAGLTKFFAQEMPAAVGELAWEVVKEAKLGESKSRAGYKISSDVFPRFRQVFERRFLIRLVPFAEEEMLAKVRASEGKFRQETIRFVADPRIFSDICELICDAVYDYLYNDGFLDLPQDWRERLAGADFPH